MSRKDLQDHLAGVAGEADKEYRNLMREWFNV